MGILHFALLIATSMITTEFVGNMFLKTIPKNALSFVATVLFAITGIIVGWLPLTAETGIGVVFAWLFANMFADKFSKLLDKEKTK